MVAWSIPQINVATALHPPGDSRIANFVDALDHINALVEASPGFVWRPQPESADAAGDPKDLRPEPFCSGRE